MIDQVFINWGVAVIGSLLGFFLRATWQAVKDLQIADKELASKVASIEVLVAGDYVKKSDFYSMSTGIFAKLDRIEDKLDKKADK